MKLWPLFVLLAACGDETVTAYADNHSYQLMSINGDPFDAMATLDISLAGKVSGSGPCNRYDASQSAPYPWFDLGPIASTKRACDELSEEVRFFGYLETMTLVEVAGRILILSNENKDEMVFQTP